MGVPATTASESASSSATTPFSSSSAVSVTSGDVVCSNTWFSASGNSAHSERNRLGDDEVSLAELREFWLILQFDFIKFCKFNSK